MAGDWCGRISELEYVAGEGVPARFRWLRTVEYPSEDFWRGYADR